MLGIAALLAAAAAAALWYFLSRKKKPEPKKPAPRPTPRGSGDSPSPSRFDEIRQKMRAKKHALIDAIAHRIEFSTLPVVLEQVKVGEEMRPTNIPSDHVAVRPIQSTDELVDVLPSAHALPDDVFYAQLATKQLPVREFSERVDIVEDRIGMPHNILVILQDVSPSMLDHERIHWNVALCQALIKRAEEGNAEIALLPFGGRAGSWVRAKTSEARNALAQRLAENVQMIDATNIDLALSKGFQLLADPAFTVRKIVLITDGTQAVEVEQARNKLKDLQIELHTVCIGVDNNTLQDVSAHYDLFPD